MAMKALIVVDMQYDFLPGGALAVNEGDAIIPIINDLMAHYDLVVATQDWHPQEHESFASNHVGGKVFDQIELNGLPQTLWPDHCIQGTKGADLSDQLDQRPIAALFRKGMDKTIDSYSGFFDNGHVKNTGLGSYLQGMAVEEVHVCGLAADYCVYYTAQDALQLGFKAAIVQNATKPIDSTNFEILKDQFIAEGGSIIIGHSFG